LRENVLRELARRAASDLEFLRRVRKDLHGTLARNGYSTSPKGSCAWWRTSGDGAPG
jgi:hypothetical protein